MKTYNYTYPLHIQIIHLGLVFFGIAAYLSAEGAEHSDGGFGYQLHAYLGLTLTFFVLLRIIRGFIGSVNMRFSSWSPLSKTQWLLATEDVKSLLRFKLPKRDLHQGIAGLTQAFGLIIFSWMATTGTILYFINENTNEIFFEIVEELHEIGEDLIPLFLLLHIGAVITYSLIGKENWRKMWPFNK